MLKTIVRIFGNAVVDAPNYRALVRAEHWHRSRIAALNSQLARLCVVQNPRRAVELSETAEQHEQAILDIRAGKAVIEMAARVMASPEGQAAAVAVPNERVMATDWRLAIAAVEGALRA